MASSDDEMEVKPQLVSDYHFEDESRELISLSVLPIQWNENERTGGDKELIYLRGTADKGLQQIYKPIIAWKFDLTNVIPEILVLSKEKSWIRLHKPRKSFEEFIRTILITVHCLSYAKRNPEATGIAIWDSLSRVFRLYEVRPSQNDLVDHMDLIKEALKRDDVLAKSKFLITFLEEKPTKSKVSNEVVQTTALAGFIVNDIEDDMVDDAEDDESNEEGGLFDSVCSFCDNGGDLLCCEGRCMRSFHATVGAGEESQCVSLGLTEDDVEAMQNFFCKNCEYKQHQCFACGKLGSSNKETGAEVFPCASATCGHFYHPHCVSKLLFRDDEVAADQLQKSIIAGDSFICPLHKCYVCKQGENKADLNLQFAVCRRCPKAYHRKCLPRKIAFEDNVEGGIITRAWEGLLPYHRILIYCLKHEIDDEIGTPIRDHIVFPGVEKKRTIIEGSGKKEASAIHAGKLKVASKKSSLTSKVTSQGKVAVKVLKRVPSTAWEGESETTKNCERLLVRSDSLRKVKETDVSRKSLKGNVKSVSVEVDRSSSADIKKTSLGDRLYAFMAQGTEQTKLGKQDNLDSENNKIVTVKPPRKKLNSELPSLDADSERRLLSLMKDAASSVSAEEILKKHKIPSTHVYSSKSVVDKAITLGKVEGSVEAIRTALKKLEVDGSSMEDAKAVCEPEVLNQIFKWKNKLKVYLAPFLHGMRYTSFGRHFTKVDKLQEIVDKLHWYVKDGDMIVDFCCGANDFSCLMKKKLDETGKNCLYKNYDILQAKNDFNFEKRDWMTVKPKELAPGSRLIMGLNPPFGVKAALANKFINKALEFNPKLLILIVPPETERLDRKKTPYELVWEDDQFLSGKSFYLPGSVDENDKQMDQWNLTAPPLYLWSRCDLAAQHKDVAEKHGHISRQQKQTQLESNCYEAHAVDCTKEKDQGDTSMQIDIPLQSNEARELRQEAREDEGGSPINATERQGASSHGHGNNQSDKNPRKRKRGKTKLGGGISENSPLDGQNGRSHLASGIYDGMSQLSPANTDVSSSLEGRSSKSIDMPSRVGFGDNDCQHLGNNGKPCSSPTKVIDGKSSLEGHSSKYIDIPSHDDGHQCDEMPHSSPVNGSNGVSSLEGPSYKPIEMPPLSPSHDDGYQCDEMPHSSPVNGSNGISSLEVPSCKPIEMPALSGIGEKNGYQHFDDGMSRHFATNVIDGGSSLQGLSSKSIDLPSYTGFDDNVHQHFGDKGVSHCSPTNMIAKSSSEDHSSKSIEIPSHTGFGSVYQRFEPTISGSHMQIGTAYDGTRAGIPSNMGSYGMSNNEPYPNLNYGFPHGVNLDERSTGHVRNIDNFGYKPFMSTSMESNIGPQARIYSQLGSLPPNVYGNLGTSAEASYRMSTSTMDRYAPRLGEFNNTRMNSFRSEPFMPIRSGSYDPRTQQPGFFANMDFAPGFHPPFPHQGSGGWLND